MPGFVRQRDAETLCHFLSRYNSNKAFGIPPFSGGFYKKRPDRRKGGGVEVSRMIIG